MPAIPKRSEVRRRTNAVPDLTRAPGAVVVPIPPAVKGWHPIARAWYRSLSGSGQSRYYEPSDWHTARLLADQMSRMLLAEYPSAAMLTAIVTATRDLMTTEGARRRLHVELTRAEDSGADEMADAEAAVDNVLALVPGAGA